MKTAIVAVYSKPGDAQYGNMEIRLTITFVSEVTYDSTEKDKLKFVDITYRHSPSGTVNKKNNYQIHVMIFIIVLQRTCYFGTQKIMILC